MHGAMSSNLQHPHTKLREATTREPVVTPVVCSGMGSEMEKADSCTCANLSAGSVRDPVSREKSDESRLPDVLL